MNKRKVGADKETLAAAFLEKQGVTILERNYRNRSGEIDLIGRDGEYLVFCEVKYRTDASTGHPAEAVDARKQRRISRCALYYLMRHGLADQACRFDVVSFEGETVTLYPNAFDYLGG